MPHQAIDLRAVARAYHCRVSTSPITARQGSKIEADLAPDPRRDQFHIRINPIPPTGWGDLSRPERDRLARHRLRFRVAHELGHVHYYVRAKGRGPVRRRPWTAAEEEACDLFARALLLPPEVARRTEPVPEAVFGLAGKFDVSVEVAARALAAEHPDVAISIWYWTLKSDPAPETLLRQWTSLSVSSLRDWRESKVVADALQIGTARGCVPALESSGTSGNGQARSDPSRRQLVLTCGA